MVFDGVGDFRFERGSVGSAAKRASVHMPAGATGDLTEFRGSQRSRAPAIEFAQRCKGDMIDVEIKSHPDRIGRNHVIDFAILEQRDLGIAAART